MKNLNEFYVLYYKEKKSLFLRVCLVQNMGGERFYFNERKGMVGE
jgi:hypothetical protein